MYGISDAPQRIGYGRADLSDTLHPWKGSAKFSVDTKDRNKYEYATIPLSTLKMFVSLQLANLLAGMLEISF